MTQSTNQPQPSQQVQGYRNDDEISLVDLALILIRHKKAIFITFSICVFLSVVASLTISPKQTFSTTIKIGGNPPVEGGDTAVAKITEAYIPMLINDSVSIEAKSPKGTNLIIMESTTRENLAEEVKTAHQKIANIVINSQNERLDQLTDQWNRDIEFYKASLAELESDSYLNALGKEISMQRSKLDSIDPNNSSDIQALRTKLGLLQDDYSKELSLQRNHKLTIQNNIAALRNKLISLEKSTTLNTAVITKESVPPTLFILAIGIITGIFLGGGVAFAREFLCKVSEAQRAQNTADT